MQLMEQITGMISRSIFKKNQKKINIRKEYFSVTTILCVFMLCCFGIIND